MPTNPRTYVDVHILHTVPPANLNRDDQGNPKEAYFGGVRRSRVSSQAWKRATRLHFTDRMPLQHLATRTRRVSGDLIQRIVVATGVGQEDAARLAAALLAPLNITAGKRQGDTAYLFFYGHRQLDSVVDLVRDRTAELLALGAKELAAEVTAMGIQEKFAAAHPLDVALFGRMVADIPALRVDAATQVAHALSTHAVDLEFDYFTAVDDRAQEEQETGAGMIGNIGFNSATLYRYATVGLHQLRHNLSVPSAPPTSGKAATPNGGRDGERAATGAAITGVQDFLTSFSRSIPSGYRNSFAHRTLPSLVAVVVREDQPVNLVSAFEEPVDSRSGIVAKSAERLAAEYLTSTRRWGDTPAFTAVCHSFDPTSRAAKQLTEAFGESRDFPDLLAGLGDHLTSAAARGPE
ncbi:type I-E CRISPR-associated protein Cas7/Cse4/CasC [Streptomyces uncialis]|uniref:type I-E CRISPR-associated protein Cas7/Cse4/CasC n=1 Tax=Streptomyces uncialis TaxID=1048205 RepID=UPI00386A83A8|nr:type I-E CRISPR-associated protein Cas7/Cse4/CasC [Streptomyces uncialis]